VFLFDTPASSYTPALTLSYEEKLEQLMRGDVRIAYLCENPIDGTFRYRVSNMIQALHDSGDKIAAVYFAEHEFARLVSVEDLADVIVVCRARYNGPLNAIIMKAQSRGKIVFYDIDDLVFDVRYAHLLLQSIDQNIRDLHAVWDPWFSSIARTGLALQLCDRAITTNRYLASKIQEWTKKPVDIIPNFLNKEQVAISRSIFKQKLDSGFKRNDQICIGYFSGSPTHNKDFAIASSALANALERDPSLTIRVVGYLDIEGPLRNYASRIQYFPRVDYINLQRLIGEVEINLIPLQENAFCHCKSELKYFEAAIVGTVSIASPTYVFTHAIRDGQTGYLASRLDWNDKLQHLLHSMESYPAMARQAFDDVKRRYVWNNQTNLIKDTLLRPQTINAALIS
jgi:glycosyltransferase involved in cell wall biosynthesis